MSKKVHLLPGAILLLIGAALVAINCRALSTFILDVVVMTISSTPPTESIDFSWGSWALGHSAREFTTLCGGLLLLCVGQALIIPGTVRRITAAAPGAGSGFARFAVLAACALTLMAAIAYALVPLSIMSTFGQLKTSGGVDPGQLAEDLPVLRCRVSMGALAGAQLLWVVAAFAAPSITTLQGSKIGKGLSIAACGAMLLFAALMGFTALGPIRSLFDMIQAVSGQSRHDTDPAQLAVKMSQALNLMLAASPLLFLVAILGLVAVLLRGKATHQE